MLSSLADLFSEVSSMRLPAAIRFSPGLISLVSLCLAAPAVSQTPASTVAQSAAQASAPSDGRVAEWMYGEHIPSVPGLPFSARVELEVVNQLQDGTLITHKTYNLDARDSQGRTRNEARNWINPSSGEEPRLTRIDLYDPSTKLRTNLYPLTKIARQWPVGTPGPIPAPSPASAPASQKPPAKK